MQTQFKTSNGPDQRSAKIDEVTLGLTLTWPGVS